LKFGFWGDRHGVGDVALFTSAWIEIDFDYAKGYQDAQVALFTSAWIEIAR